MHNKLSKQWFAGKCDLGIVSMTRYVCTDTDRAFVVTIMHQWHHVVEVVLDPSQKNLRASWLIVDSRDREERTQPRTATTDYVHEQLAKVE